MKPDEIETRVRTVCRLKHWSYKTEVAYLAQIRRFTAFVRSQPAGLSSEEKVRAFLESIAPHAALVSGLTVGCHVSATEANRDQHTNTTHKREGGDFSSPPSVDWWTLGGCGVRAKRGTVDGGLTVDVAPSVVADAARAVRAFVYPPVSVRVFAPNLKLWLAAKGSVWTGGAS